MPLVNFAEIKQSIPIVDVINWLGIQLKPSGVQLVGKCPLCGRGGDNGFKVTPSKNLWNSFCGCGGGTIIDLVAFHHKCGTREAAVMLQEHFLSGGNRKHVSAPAEHSSPPITQKQPENGEVLKPLDYLEADHPMVAALGLTPEVCKAFGWGYAPKGTMKGRFLVALHRQDGQLLGYLGIASKEEMAPLLKFPSNLPQKVAQADTPKDEPATGTYGFLRIVK